MRQKKAKRKKIKIFRGRQDSNLQPFGPKPNALSIALRPHMHVPGIEPGSTAWQAAIIPLNQTCLSCKFTKNK